jgi:hypothetical protein
MPVACYCLYSSFLPLVSVFSSSLVCTIHSCVQKRFLSCASSQRAAFLALPELAVCTTMSHLSPEARHHILLEYAPHDATRSFAALARRHAVRGGERTIRRWHEQWNGTPQSLQRKEGSGKARTLTTAEVSRHIRAPILAANRAHRAIHYTELLPEVQRKTGKRLSLRTLQQYGKEELGAKQKHTKKRTAEESECTRTCHALAASLCGGLCTDSLLQCLLIPVSRLLPSVANSSAQRLHASSSSMRLHCDSMPLRITH